MPDKTSTICLLENVMSAHLFGMHVAVNESLCYQWLYLQVLNHNVIVDIEASFNVTPSVKYSEDEYHHIPQSR